MVMRKKRICYTRKVKAKKTVKRKVMKKPVMKKYPTEIILNNNIRGQNIVFGYGRAKSVRRNFKSQEDAKRYARNQAKKFGLTSYFNLAQGRKVRV